MEEGATGAVKRRKAVWMDRAGGAAALTGYRWRRKGRGGHRFSVELQVEATRFSVGLQVEAKIYSVELQARCRQN